MSNKELNMIELEKNLEDCLDEGIKEGGLSGYDVWVVLRIVEEEIIFCEWRGREKFVGNEDKFGGKVGGYFENGIRIIDDNNIRKLCSLIRMEIGKIGSESGLNVCDIWNVFNRLEDKWIVDRLRDLCYKGKKKK